MKGVKQSLSERDWSDVLGSNDVDRASVLLKQHFIAALDTVALLKETRMKQISANWMTSEIVDIIRQRDRWIKKVPKI